MLQTRASREQTLYEDRGQDRGPGLSPLHYYEILKRRIFYFLIPCVVVAVIGALVAVFWPAIYASEGKILVESQAIPTDLVRPTVTTLANERVQVIEQRIMTRDNLLAIVDKFQVFGDRRQRLSGTEVLDLMRESTKFRPFDVKRRSDVLTIAFTISFEHERPEIAVRVANEFLTLILNEDARARTARAIETTRFLAREVSKLEGELGAMEAKILEAKRQRGGAVPDQLLVQLATLRADLLLKSAVYSDTHPELVALKRRIGALEQIMGQTKQVETGLDALQRQEASIQKSLEAAAQKLSAARVGESLERDQQSERLEVIEQPTMPQRPVKPNRWRIFALALALAGMAGVGTVFAAEAFNQTIRSRQDLIGVTDAHLVVVIPYITTRAETLRQKGKLVWAAGILAIGLLTSLAVFHFLVYPLDLLWMYGFAWLFR